MDVKCPKCSRKVKLVECICKDKGRKRIMVSFPCHHFHWLVYNTAESTDDNTILKDFKSVFEEHSNRKYYSYGFEERYL